MSNDYAYKLEEVINWLNGSPTCDVCGSTVKAWSIVKDDTNQYGKDYHFIYCKNCDEQVRIAKVYDRIDAIVNKLIIGKE